MTVALHSFFFFFNEKFQLGYMLTHDLSLWRWTSWLCDMIRWGLKQKQQCSFETVGLEQAYHLNVSCMTFHAICCNMNELHKLPYHLSQFCMPVHRWIKVAHFSDSTRMLIASKTKSCNQHTAILPSAFYMKHTDCNFRARKHKTQYSCRSYLQ